MASSPHLVLDGAVLAAEITGARKAVIVVHRDVRGDPRPGRGRTRPGRPRPGAARGPHGGGGVRGRPGERGRAVDPAGSPRAHRDAAAARPARPARGADAGAERRDARAPRAHRPLRRVLVPLAGTPAEPGSMLVTVLGAVREPGVREVAIGTPVGQLLDLAGGASAPLQALLLGGYFGTWVDAAEASGRPFSSAGLADLGAGPGAGLIAALPAGACGLSETARVVRYLAGESAGPVRPVRIRPARDRRPGRAARGRAWRRPRPVAPVARPGRRPRRLRPPGRRRPAGAQRPADVRPRAELARRRPVLRTGRRVARSARRRAARSARRRATRAARRRAGRDRRRRCTRLGVDFIACDGRGPVRRGAARADHPRRLGLPGRQRSARAAPAAGRRPRDRLGVSQARAPARRGAVKARTVRLYSVVGLAPATRAAASGCGGAVSARRRSARRR